MGHLKVTFSHKQFLPDGSSWVFALPSGATVYDGERMRELEHGLLLAIHEQTTSAISSFDAIAAATGATPYRFAVVRDHDLRGPSYGTIEETRIASRAGKSGLWFRVLWTPSARADIEAGRIRHVSVGINEYTNQLGQRFSPVAHELSLTLYPRIQSLGTIQETLGMSLSALARNEEPMDPEKIAEIILQQLLPTLEAFAARLDALESAAQLADDLVDEVANEVAEEVADEEFADEELVDEEEAVNEEALVAALTATLEKGLKPLVDKIDKLSRLNLSATSTPAPRVRVAQPSAEARFNNAKTPEERWAAYDELKKQGN